MIEGNKEWLCGDFFLDHSGSSLEEGIYDRYWYGWVKVSGEDFFSVIEKIKLSK